MTSGTPFSPVNINLNVSLLVDTNALIKARSGDPNDPQTGSKGHFPTPMQIEGESTSGESGDPDDPNDNTKPSTFSVGAQS